MQWSVDRITVDGRQDGNQKNPDGYYGSTSLPCLPISTIKGYNRGKGGIGGCQVGAVVTVEGSSVDSRQVESGE